MAEERFERLKRKYDAVFHAFEQNHIRLSGSELRNDRLVIRGEAPSQAAVKNVQDVAAQIDTDSTDLVLDITVASVRAAAAGAAETRHEIYTVQPGDTLAKIARDYYGDSRQYLRIYQANMDKLDDPDDLRTGQQLVIPLD